MHSGSDTVVAEPGEVNLAFMHIGRDWSFGRSGAQLSLCECNLEHRTWVNAKFVRRCCLKGPIK